ncbi:diguanylate cyclase [Pelomonas sp. P7]|uniref:diguanylate cyclase n=1 Tax=Pelomonas caseinilytica TaxID=2906763 RepID=A0ABS8XGW2_9BURK|nr:diguanylate cyclase [Pelomonas sp. P7]
MGRRLVRLLLVGSLAAAVLGAQAQQRAFHYLRQEQGLENLAVTALAQGAGGEVWIGTENGLYHFDGTRIRGYGVAQGLADPRVNSLHVDAAGLLWVGTETMLFHQAREGFQQVTRDGRPIAPQPGQSLTSSREALIVNARDGLYRVQRGPSGWVIGKIFEARDREHQPELKDIWSVLAEPGGDLWFGCGLALCRWSDGRLRLYGAAGRGSTAPLGSLMRTADGELWMRSRDRLWQLPLGAEKLLGVDLPATAAAPAPMSPPLIVDGQGRLLTQWGVGVARWDGNAWEAVGVGEGLRAGGGVSALLLTRDGGIWLGTAGAGLAHWLGYRHAQSWGLTEGLPSEDSWAFLRSAAGALYFGTGAGLAVRANDHATKATLVGDPREPPDVASSLAEDSRGRIWVGSFEGALRVFDPRTGKYRHVARLPRITSLLVDLTGQLWITTHGGVYVVAEPVRDALPRRIDKDNAGRRLPQVHGACIAADGQVWFHTQAGLFRSDGQRVVEIRLVGDATQLPESRDFAALACGQDRIWLGGGMAGLWEGRLQADGTARLATVDAPLLQGRSIVGLHLDRRGWLWAATDYGVAVWNMKRWRFVRDGDGLPWNDCNQGAIYEDRDGSMWIGTSRGAAHFDELEALFAEPRLDVRLRVAGHDVPAAGDGNPGLVLPWQKQGVVLHLTSSALESRGALRFEYRMAGLEEEWRSGTETQLAYPGLAPGQYRFEVRARNLDLQAESALQTLDLEILPPWWRTNGFYMTLAAMAALLVWAAYDWRLRTILRHQRHLERLVAERTREIEASHAQMRELALKDGLTGVLNRRALGEALAADVSRASRSRQPLALVLVDADRFKLVNDRHGHQAGDAVLVAIAQRLQGLTRAYDHLGRYGGEEFVLVLPDLDISRPEGRARIEAFHRSICASPVAVPGGALLDVTCSFGVASLAFGRLESAEELISRADAALYRAKANGRNRVEYADPGASD